MFNINWYALVLNSFIDLMQPLILLQSLPRLRFNKEGSLLVVNTSNNGFKVLANADGLRSLRAIEARSYDTSRATNEMKVVISCP